MLVKASQNHSMLGAGLEHNGQVFHYNEDVNGDVMDGVRLEWQRTAG